MIMSHDSFPADMQSWGEPAGVEYMLPTLSRPTISGSQDKFWSAPNPVNPALEQFLFERGTLVVFLERYAHCLQLLL